MKCIYLVISIIFFYSCEAQKPKSKSNSKMEKFNIQEFNTKKNADEYTRILDDKTVITQFGNESGYTEKTVPATGWFYTYKSFYGNGNLKIKGTAFKKGDYKEGLWVECDTDGNVTKETNYSNSYKLSLDAVFDILAKKKIKFSLADPINEIRRDVVEGKSTWFIEWKEKPGRIEQMQIDDASGKITSQNFYKHQEDH